MPPGSRRRKIKGDASDASEAQTDATMGPPPTPVPRIRHTESEMSSSDGDEGKRYKPGTPRATRAAVAGAAVAAEGVAVGGVAASVASISGSDVAAPVAAPKVRESRQRRKMAPDNGVIDELKAVTTSLLEEVMVDGVPAALGRSVLGLSSRYESLVMRMLAENERLRGRLDVYEAGAVARGGGPAAVSRTAAAPPAPVAARRSLGQFPALPAAAVVAPKPVETWSVVVRGKKGVTSKEVVDKVVKEVGPTLGVRVHEVRPTRDGGAVIRTPSVAERQKVAANRKFEEVGLEVSVKDKLGPKVVVQRVHPEITPDVFMEELYAWNFKHRMTPENFRKSVRLVTGPWKPTGNAVNVVLEGSDDAMQLLLDNGRCYIKWFSFAVRQHDAVPSCYRCLGFDHMVRECRMREEVCRICCQAGHRASRCTSEPYCRNCALKGLPAGHLMMSSVCPVYSGIVARANARH